MPDSALRAVSSRRPPAHPINRAIRDLVFQPLGLEHAGTTAGDFIVQRFAAGHTTRDGKTTLQRPFSGSTSVTAGGVGLCMTDLLAYARFHMGDGTRGERRACAQAGVARADAHHAGHKQGTDDDIGLGWHIRTVGPVRTYRTRRHAGRTRPAARARARAQLRHRHPDECQYRLAPDSGRRARSLESYLGATYSPNQAIAHRGLVETLPSVQPLAQQPDLAPYVGTYARPNNRTWCASRAESCWCRIGRTRGSPGRSFRSRSMGRIALSSPTVPNAANPSSSCATTVAVSTGSVSSAAPRSVIALRGPQSVVRSVRENQARTPTIGPRTPDHRIADPRSSSDNLW